MDIFNRAARLMASAAILTLAACSSGGGNGANLTPGDAAPTPPTPTDTATPSTPTPSADTTTSSTFPPPTISPPNNISSAGSNTAFNFTDNPPHVGENGIPLAGTAVVLGANSVRGYVPSSGEGSTITYRGTVVNNGVTYPVFDLIVPTLSLTAKNLRGDGTLLVLPDGGEVRATVSTMTYTALGMWTYKPASSTSGIYVSYANTGSATPAANVPSNGTAVFKGGRTTGGVIGTYWEPSPTGTVQGGSLKGNADITVNFASDSFTGTFNNMTATPPGGTPTPWNDVTFSGTLGRATHVGASARANASPPPAGAIAGFSSAATGGLQGTFQGPNAEELGGSWILSDQTSAGGKVAIGSFGAAR